MQAAIRSAPKARPCRRRGNAEACEHCRRNVGKASCLPAPCDPPPIRWLCGEWHRRGGVGAERPARLIENLVRVAMIGGDEEAGTGRLGRNSDPCQRRIRTARCCNRKAVIPRWPIWSRLAMLMIIRSGPPGASATMAASAMPAADISGCRENSLSGTVGRQISSPSRAGFNPLRK